MYPRKSVSISRRPSSLIFSHDRFSAIGADQIERNSERNDVLEEKQAEIVHVMHAVNHDGVIRSRDQHAACGESLDYYPCHPEPGRDACLTRCFDP